MEDGRAHHSLLFQVAFIVALLLAGGAAVVFGLGVFANSVGLSDRVSERPPSSCPFRSGCTTLTVAEVSRESGFTFPAGSAVEWAHEETSWFDNSWTMRALVRMPPGSAAPRTAVSDRTASVKKDDASGVDVEVSVLAVQGR